MAKKEQGQQWRKSTRKYWAKWFGDVEVIEIHADVFTLYSCVVFKDVKKLDRVYVWKCISWGCLELATQFRFPFLLTTCLGPDITLGRTFLIAHVLAYRTVLLCTV